MKIIKIINAIGIIGVLLIWAISGERPYDWYVAMMLGLYVVTLIIDSIER